MGSFIPPINNAINPLLLKQQQERKARFQARVSDVWKHENAHAAAAGGLGGAPAVHADESSGEVSGHVPIQMEFGKTADDALRFAAQIVRAALAPADPSSQDLNVSRTAQAFGSRLAQSRRMQEAAHQEHSNPPQRSGVPRWGDVNPQPFTKPKGPNPFMTQPT